MLYKSGDVITFAGHYIDNDGKSISGLTVTVNIIRVENNGTHLQVVTNGTTTDIGDGVYMYQYTTPTPGNYTFFVIFKDNSGNASVVNIAATAISGPGWVNAAAALPGNVWSFVPRTTTDPASIVNQNNEKHVLVIYKYNSFEKEIVVGQNLATAQEVIFTIKSSFDDSDEDADFQISSTRGLVRVGGAAPEANMSAAITVNGSAKSVKIEMDPNVAGKLTVGNFNVWDIKAIISSDKTILADIGTADIRYAVTIKS